MSTNVREAGEAQRHILDAAKARIQAAIVDAVDKDTDITVIQALHGVDFALSWIVSEGEVLIATREKIDTLEARISALGG